MTKKTDQQQTAAAAPEAPREGNAPRAIYVETGEDVGMVLIRPLNPFDTERFLGWFATDLKKNGEPDRRSRPNHIYRYDDMKKFGDLMVTIYEPEREAKAEPIRAELRNARKVVEEIEQRLRLVYARTTQTAAVAPEAPHTPGRKPLDQMLRECVAKLNELDNRIKSIKPVKTKLLAWPSVEEQIEHWKAKEALEPDQIEASCDWYDRNDDGRSYGDGESYAERNQ